MRLSYRVHIINTCGAEVFYSDRITALFEIVALTKVRRGYSSVVEHSTADREVPGSNPGVPYHFRKYSSGELCRRLFIFQLRHHQLSHYVN